MTYFSTSMGNLQTPETAQVKYKMHFFVVCAFTYKTIVFVATVLGVWAVTRSVLLLKEDLDGLQFISGLLRSPTRVPHHVFSR